MATNRLTNTTPEVLDTLGNTNITATNLATNNTNMTATTITPANTENEITTPSQSTMETVTSNINIDSQSIKNTDALNPLLGKTAKDTTSTSNNMYYEVLNSSNTKPEYKGTGGDVSAGASAASGTQYSWDKQGADKTQNQYQQDVLGVKQEALANRQNIEQNALQYQQQADMMRYTNNQEAEKVGWTGGYVLDQNRQMEYLKASIQAQMYGAMELQKYGYDSALAAARLSYDLNQQEFAHQYYQDAVNVAISEAQITGTYFSAETRDMMSQYNVADEVLKDLANTPLDVINERIKDGTLVLSEEQLKAVEIKKNIEAWYKANNVSTTGIQTLAAWEAEQSMAQQWADSQWSKYQAAMQTADNKVSEDINAFIKLDKNGNPIYDGASVSIGNFRTMSPAEIVAYAKETGTEGKQQVYGYIDNTFEKIITDYLATTTKKTNEDGSVTYTIDSDKLKGNLESNVALDGLDELLPGYEYTTQASDSAVSIKVDDKGNITVEVSVSKSNSKSYETIVDETTGNELYYWTGNRGGNAQFTYAGTGDNYSITVKDTEYKVTVIWGDYISNSGANGYTLKQIKDINKELKEKISNSKNGDIVYYNNSYWIYQTDGNEWGLLVTGEEQDKKASDAEKLISDLYK